MCERGRRRLPCCRSSLPFLIRIETFVSGSLIGSVVGAPCGSRGSMSGHRLAARVRSITFLYFYICRYSIFYFSIPWFLMRSLVHWYSFFVLCFFGDLIFCSALHVGREWRGSAFLFGGPRRRRGGVYYYLLTSYFLFPTKSSSSRLFRTI